MISRTKTMRSDMAILSSHVERLVCPFLSSHTAHALYPFLSTPILTSAKYLACSKRPSPTPSEKNPHKGPQRNAMTKWLKPGESRDVISPGIPPHTQKKRDMM